MTAAKAFSGGCQCGAIRFQAHDLGTSAICHCRMCQKAFGSYFGPLVSVGVVSWTRGQPKYFRSSNKARRGFCPRCGTPLCYVDESGSVELAGGAFDAPSVAPPTIQYNLRDKVNFFDSLPSLPRQPHEDKESAFNALVVKRQHPDRDTAEWPVHEPR